jgi:hypothetical protein
VEGQAEEDPVAQQAVLDVWRQTFNEQRPHEALGMRVPRDVYHVSPRKYDPTAVELTYPPGYLVRQVRRRGQVAVAGRSVLVSSALGGHQIGLEPIQTDRYAVWFCRLRLGEVDLTTDKFHAAGPGPDENPPNAET